MIAVTEANYNDVLSIRKAVMYPDKDIDYVRLPDDDMGIHLGVFEDGVLMSIGSIFMHEGRNLQLRKLATLTDKQGKGYASQLIKWLIDYAIDMKLNSIWCNARKDAVMFYQKLGFEETEESFSRDGIDYVIVKKALV